MEGEPRRRRADAERNRRRLIEAATAMTCERGLDVGVGEIAERAGVGRGTLFRHFPSKEALMTAVMAQRIREAIDRGHESLTEPDAGEALFSLIDDTLERLQVDRAIVDALADEWNVHPEIRSAHEEMLSVLGQIVARAQDAGAVRDDIGAVDVLLMVKGVCEASRAFAGIDPAILQRQVDLVKAAISVGGQDLVPLRGVPPTAADLECDAVPARCAGEVVDALG